MVGLWSVDEPWPVGAIGASASLVACSVPPLKMRSLGEEDAGVIGAPHPLLATPLSAATTPLTGSAAHEVTLLVRRFGRLCEGRNALRISRPGALISLQVLSLRRRPAHERSEIGRGNRSLPKGHCREAGKEACQPLP